MPSGDPMQASGRIELTTAELPNEQQFRHRLQGQPASTIRNVAFPILVFGPHVDACR